ncbi:MAG: type II toxin-antitoxin system ParD family antitoxin [Microvirga sp.]|jgi:antitoxin ParD1/3/4|nr:type II toxin-antitoxin system ParD family antitoxin [Beijerinckiaceae bacterium]
MAKTYTIRPDLEAFVDQLVASGRYERPEDAIAEGLELLKDQELAREGRRAELSAKIEEGMEDIRAGRVHDAEDVFREMEELIASKEGNRDAAE